MLGRSGQQAGEEDKAGTSGSMFPPVSFDEIGLADLHLALLGDKAGNGPGMQDLLAVIVEFDRD